MKLQVSRFLSKDYYIRINCGDYISLHDNIAKTLDIPIEEYCQILISNGAHRIHPSSRWDAELEFKKKSDAEAVVKILEPRLIMAKLLQE